MLFPNHPAYAEIRAGMGYQPGAHALLGYAAPWHGLGIVSEAQMQAAWDQGLDGPTLDALSAAGATDADIQALMVGDTDVATLMEKYAGLKSTEGTTVTETSTPASASQGQLPTGSQFSYAGGWSPIHGSVSDVQAALSSQLPSRGMQLVAFNSTGSSLLGVGTAGFTATIAVTGVGFALLSDAQSIVVTIVQSVIGSRNLTTNQAALISTPSTPAGTVQPSASNLGAWLEENALYIALGVGGLVLLNNFTGRRR